MANTPVRSIRVEHELWAKLECLAEGKGVTVSEVIRVAIAGAVK